MNIKSHSGFNPLKAFNESRWLKQSVGLISGLGLLGSGLLWTAYSAQATTDVVVIEENSAPANVTPPPEVKPVVPLKQKPTTIQPVNSPAPQVQLSAPKITIPETSSVQPPAIISPQNQPRPTENISNEVQTGKNNYIDPIQYGNQPSTPPSVVITERSTGCQTIAQNGQLTGGQCGGAIKKQPIQPENLAKNPLPPRRLIIANQTPVRNNLIVASQTKTVRIVTPTSFQNRLQPQPVRESQVVSLKPIEMNGVKIALAPINSTNQTIGVTIPLPTANRRTDLIFPLSMPASFSSPFGWRVHPIAGGGRMHEGTDIAAPIGTPVVAAYAGEVAYANVMGGYGNIVILRHTIPYPNGTQQFAESRYGHLSEIDVQPGQKIEQGQVIGKVGSTGFSTGPHLHFEWRYFTAQGWVAVDAGVHLEYALENLIQGLRLSQETTKQPG